MTSTTLPQPGKLLNVFVTLFLIVGLMLLAGMVLNHHSVSKHGADARAVKSCLDRNGPYQTWKSKYEPNTYMDICGFVNGQWGVRIYTSIDGVEEEQTAYIFTKGNGSLTDLIRYLSKFATRFTGFQ